MRTEPGTTGRRRARVIATLAAGVLALTGAVAIGVAVAGQEPAPPSPPAAQSQGEGESPSAEESAAEAEQPQDPAESPQPPAEASAQQENDESSSGGPSAAEGPEGLDYSEPASIQIPAINTSSSSLEDLELNSEGVMTTPDDPDKAGWFTPSPPPGVHGVSVITGHVTWNEERGVFFRLGDLRKGDRVEVTRKDGVTAIFEVTRIGTFPKEEFPTEAVYGATEYPSLRLITCGGAYDEGSNNYLSNVIVWAKMVDSVKA